MLCISAFSLFWWRCMKLIPTLKDFVFVNNWYSLFQGLHLIYFPLRVDISWAGHIVLRWPTFLCFNILRDAHYMKNSSTAYMIIGDIAGTIRKTKY
jgi:hypothetical protein